MARSHPILVALVAVMLGLFSIVPAEDVLETAYDESESLPYAATSIFPIAVASAIIRLLVGHLRVSLSRLGCSRSWTHFFLSRGEARNPICESLTILDHTLRC